MKSEKLNENSMLKYLLYEDIDNGKIGNITTKFMGYLLSFSRIELEDLESLLMEKLQASVEIEQLDYTVIDSINILNQLIDDFLKKENNFYDRIKNFASESKVDFEYDEITQVFESIIELIDKITKIKEKLKKWRFQMPWV